MTTRRHPSYSNVPVATLRWWRHQRTGLKGFHMGARKVMYRRSDIDSWLEKRYSADGNDPINVRRPPK